jgi:hypothetical protein
MEEYFIVSCPHCMENIIIYEKEIKCAIFRHGVYKDTYKQIDPHLPKNECDNLAKNNKIIGCGKPFKLIKNESWTTIICDYI